MEKLQQWQKVKEILGSVLERPVPERRAYLDQVCLHDSELRGEVESLLSAYPDSGALLESFRPDSAAEAETEKQVIGPYRLLHELGVGGMGQVWLAAQSEPIRRHVAVKLIRAGMYDPSTVQRFKAERQSLAIMDHPAIAKIFDAGTTAAGQPYLVMEYVAGKPITEYCDSKKLAIRERLQLFLQVCEGVQHAHQKAIIHRDLKPSNILVVEVDGKPMPRIIDFGLAKAAAPLIPGETLFTQVGTFLGTPGYMSPEQADPEMRDIDTRTDVYSAGAVLYELMTGSPPFDPRLCKKRRSVDVLRELRESDPERPSTRVGIDRETAASKAEARATVPKQLIATLRGDLDWIALKALEKDRERRYAMPSALAADLENYLHNRPVSARPASIRYRARKYAQRHLAGVAVAAAVGLLLVGFGIMQAFQLRRITRERDRADRIAEFMTGIFKLADPNERVGNEVTVREVLDKASQDIDKGLTKDPVLQAQLMHVMGNAYLNLGQYARAQSLYERGIQVSSSVGGQRSHDTLKTMHDLAWTLMQQGHLAQAESLERKVLEAERREFGSDDPDTLGTLSELAFTLCQEGNCKEAVELDTEVLEKQKRILGPEAEGTLITMDNLAINLAGAGRPADAVKLETQALEIHFRIDGGDNLGTVNAITNLAGFFRDLGRYEDSEKQFREALDIETRIFGPEQAETAETKYDLASLLARKGQTEEALSLLDQAVGHGLPPLVAGRMDQDPFLRALHSNPRFAELLHRVRMQQATQKAD